MLFLENNRLLSLNSTPQVLSFLSYIEDFHLSTYSSSILLISVLTKAGGLDLWNHKRTLTLYWDVQVTLAVKTVDILFIFFVVVVMLSVSAHEISWYSHFLWDEDVKVQVYGKMYSVPRKQATYGDEGLVYSFSGVHLAARVWTPTLEYIRDAVTNATGHTFNFVLINRRLLTEDLLVLTDYWLLIWFDWNSYCVCVFVLKTLMFWLSTGIKTVWITSGNTGTTSMS